jgi:hypothetical protein
MRERYAYGWWGDSSWTQGRISTGAAGEGTQRPAVVAPTTRTCSAAANAMDVSISNAWRALLRKCSFVNVAASIVHLRPLNACWRASGGRFPSGLACATGDLGESWGSEERAYIAKISARRRQVRSSTQHNHSAFSCTVCSAQLGQGYTLRQTRCVVSKPRIDPSVEATARYLALPGPTR